MSDMTGDKDKEWEKEDLLIIPGDSLTIELHLRAMKEKWPGRLIMEAIATASGWSTLKYDVKVEQLSCRRCTGACFVIKAECNILTIGRTSSSFMRSISQQTARLSNISISFSHITDGYQNHTPMMQEPISLATAFDELVLKHLSCKIPLVFDIQSRQLSTLLTVQESIADSFCKVLPSLKTVDGKPEDITKQRITETISTALIKSSLSNRVTKCKKEDPGQFPVNEVKPAKRRKSLPRRSTGSAACDKLELINPIPLISVRPLSSEFSSLTLSVPEDTMSSEETFQSLNSATGNENENETCISIASSEFLQVD